MAAIANGMAAYGHFIPYVATFLVFTGYMFGAMRVSALSGFRVIYVMTHDSIGLGEDGPTHQPIEVLAMLRATPNIQVIRPADGNEVSGAYKIAINSPNTPTVICLTRQNVPTLEGTSIQKTELGAYILQDCDGKPDIILIGTGSEVSLCVEAAKHEALKGKKVRIVSMPCQELFDKQPEDYRKKVLLQDVPVLSVEAASTLGWQKYSHAQIGMKTFGMSAPYEKLYEYFGFTPLNIAQKAAKLISYYEGKNVPNLHPLQL